MEASGGSFERRHGTDLALRRFQAKSQTEVSPLSWDAHDSVQPCTFLCARVSAAKTEGEKEAGNPARMSRSCDPMRMLFWHDCCYISNRTQDLLVAQKTTRISA